jgi:hypothetical protein
VIADRDQLSDSWFKTEILKGLNDISIEWIVPSDQENEEGVVAVEILTPNGLLRID